uniref:Neuronal acetylcholine receptor subunit alpha-6 n=1 Tax=Magallana gigas TaxID=29159 RepID=K1QL92_MAGGI
MKDFNKYVRPTEVSPVTVNVTFFLVGIKEFDEVNGMFSVTGFFQVTWQDSRLRWNSSDYGDLQTLELPERKTWIPNISLLNPYVRVERIAKGVSPVRYSSSGIAVWLPGDVLSSRCEVDVTKYPFDTQTCRLLFGCWGYPSSSIVVQAPNPKVGTFYFIEHDTWEIVHQRVETVSDLFLTYVSVDITMKRHPGFAVINVVLPLIFFGLMNIFVFILPTESGERLSYCVTVLLAIAVFLTIVEQNLPPTSDPISILSYYVLANLGMSCFICFVVIIGLDAMRGETEPWDRSDHTVLRHVTCSVPGTLQIFIAGWTSYTWGKCADAIPCTGHEDCGAVHCPTGYAPYCATILFNQCKCSPCKSHISLMRGGGSGAHGVSVP